MDNQGESTIGFLTSDVLLFDMDSEEYLWDLIRIKFEEWRDSALKMIPPEATVSVEEIDSWIELGKILREKGEVEDISQWRDIMDLLRKKGFSVFKRSLSKLFALNLVPPFESQREIETYLDRFYEKGADSYKKLVRILIYYRYMKKTTRENEPLRALMIFSMIEALYSRDYVEFEDWISDEKIKRRIIQFFKGKTGDEQKIFKEFTCFLNKLKKEYKDEHGSTRKVVRFFTEKLDESEKIDIIERFKFPKPVKKPHYPKDMEKYLKRYAEPKFGKSLIEKFGRIFVSLCFDPKKCYFDDSGCFGSRKSELCLIRTDVEQLNQTMQKVASRVIYAMRSGFVHEATIPPFNEVGMPLYDEFEKKGIISEFSIQDLNRIFERKFKDLLENYLKLC